MERLWRDLRHRCQNGTTLQITLKLHRTVGREQGHFCVVGGGKTKSNIQYDKLNVEYLMGAVDAGTRSARDARENTKNICDISQKIFAATRWLGGGRAGNELTPGPGDGDQTSRVSAPLRYSDVPSIVAPCPQHSGSVSPVSVQCTVGQIRVFCPMGLLDVFI